MPTCTAITTSSFALGVLMSMLLTILVVVTLLSFASPSTRWLGLLSVALLIHLQPFWTFTALALLGGAYFFMYR